MISFSFKIEAPAEFITLLKFRWVPDLNFYISYGYNGLQTPVLLLLSIAMPVGLFKVFSLNDGSKIKITLYLLFCLMLLSIIFSENLILLIVSFFLAILFFYFLCLELTNKSDFIYGSKIFIRCFLFSALLLMAIILTYILSGEKSLGLEELRLLNFASRIFNIGNFSINGSLLNYAMYFLPFFLMVPVAPFIGVISYLSKLKTPLPLVLYTNLLLPIVLFLLIKLNIFLFPDTYLKLKEIYLYLGVVGVFFSSVGFCVSDTEQKRYSVLASYVTNFVFIGMGVHTTYSLTSALFYLLGGGLGMLLYGIILIFLDKLHSNKEQTSLTLDKKDIAFFFFISSSVFLCVLGFPPFSAFMSYYYILLGGFLSAPGLFFVFLVSVFFLFYGFCRHFISNREAIKNLQVKMEDYKTFSKVMFLVFTVIIIIGVIPASVLERIPVSYYLNQPINSQDVK